MKKHFFIQTITVILVSLVVFSCNRTGKQSKGDASARNEASVRAEEFDSVKMKARIVEIIQKVPKGSEIADLLNEAGASYIVDLTVSPGNIEKMLTTTQKALGAGMFAFDTKYAAVYKRGDIVLQSRKNVNQLSIELGLEEDLTYARKYTERLEKNRSNSDSLEFLAAQMAKDYHQYMQQGKHSDIYALGSIGANIEALYVLSQMTLLAINNEKLLAVMNNQNERVKTLATLLEIMSGDKNVKPYYESIEPVFKFLGEKTTITVSDLKTIVPMIEKARNRIIQ